MLIDFENIPEREVKGMNGGEGSLFAKMYMGEHGKLIPCRMAPGASIGMHAHPTSDDINFVLSGTGKAVVDGKEEPLRAGVCHICPKGSSHAICNTGADELVLLTVVVER